MTVPDSAHAHNLTVDVLTTGDGVSVQSLKIEETNSSMTVSEAINLMVIQKKQNR